MHPVVFTIPGLNFAVPAFGMMLACAFLVGTYIWGRLIVRHGHDPAGDPIRVEAVTLAVLIGVVAGGRCFYVIVEILRYLSLDTAAMPPGMAESYAGYKYLENPLSILYVWQGGLVMYGGFLGAIALGMRSAKKHGLHAVNALDTGLVSGFIGQAIGRIGCLLVGDDFGSIVPTDMAHLPFPITFTVPDLEWLLAHPKSLFPHELAGQTLWATQIWMSFNALCLGLLGIYLLRKRRFMGQVSLILIMIYSVGRFTIEAFRGDKIRGLWFGESISTSQLISILCGLIALGIYIRLRKFREDVPGSATAAE